VVFFSLVFAGLPLDRLGWVVYTPPVSSFPPWQGLVMLIRVPSFAEALGVSPADQRRIEALAHATAQAAQGMAHLDDYRALGAICCDLRPKRIFEIGTFLGTTSNFFLELLPEAVVVSIAYVRPRLRFWSPKYNNSSLAAGEIGSRVSPANRPRFRQLLGDSHRLVAAELLREFGPFDLVFIDGDHTHRGVALDTELSRQILSERGGIAWHDANPVDKYLDVRRYLERDLFAPALATTDHYWHPALAARGLVCPPPESAASAA
jgi:predicted O-methyltransferase YrrM